MIKKLWYRYKLRRLQKQILSLEHFENQLYQTAEELKFEVLPSLRKQEERLRCLSLNN